MLFSSFRAFIRYFGYDPYNIERSLWLYDEYCDAMHRCTVSDLM